MLCLCLPDIQRQGELSKASQLSTTTITIYKETQRREKAALVSLKLIYSDGNVIRKDKFSSHQERLLPSPFTPHTELFSGLSNTKTQSKILNPSMPQPKQQAVSASNSTCSIFMCSKEKMTLTPQCSGSPGQEGHAVRAGQVPIISCSYQSFCSCQHTLKTRLRSWSFSICSSIALYKHWIKCLGGSPGFKGELHLGPSLGGVWVHPMGQGKSGWVQAHLTHKGQKNNL